MRVCEFVIRERYDRDLRLECRGRKGVGFGRYFRGRVGRIYRLIRSGGEDELEGGGRDG